MSVCPAIDLRRKNLYGRRFNLETFRFPEFYYRATPSIQLVYVYIYIHESQCWLLSNLTWKDLQVLLDELYNFSLVKPFSRLLATSDVVNDIIHIKQNGS